MLVRTPPKHFVYLVKNWNPFSGATLLVVALLASFVPACATSKVNPIQALRHE